MSNVRSAVTDELDFYGLSTPMELVETYGSPLYVYNENVLRRRCRELKGLSSHPGFRVNYSAKANANLSLLRIYPFRRTGGGCHVSRRKSPCILRRDSRPTK